MSERAALDPAQYERLSQGSVPGYAALQDVVAVAAAAAGFTTVTPILRSLAVHTALAVA